MKTIGSIKDLLNLQCEFAMHITTDTGFLRFRETKIYLTGDYHEYIKKE